VQDKEKDIAKQSQHAGALNAQIVGLKQEIEELNEQLLTTAKELSDVKKGRPPSSRLLTPSSPSGSKIDKNVAKKRHISMLWGEKKDRIKKHASVAVGSQTSTESQELSVGLNMPFTETTLPKFIVQASPRAASNPDFKSHLGEFYFQQQKDIVEQVINAEALFLPTLDLILDVCHIIPFPLILYLTQ